MMSINVFIQEFPPVPVPPQKRAVLASVAAASIFLRPRQNSSVSADAQLESFNCSELKFPKKEVESPLILFG